MNTTPTPTNHQPVAAETCAPEPHVWVANMRGGEPIHVEICMGCGQFNWDGLREQVAALIAARGELAKTRAELASSNSLIGCLYAAGVDKWEGHAAAVETYARFEAEANPAAAPQATCSCIVQPLLAPPRVVHLSTCELKAAAPQADESKRVADVSVYYSSETGSHGWRCATCGGQSRPIMPAHAAEDAMRLHRCAPLPVAAPDPASTRRCASKTPCDGTPGPFDLLCDRHEPCPTCGSRGTHDIGCRGPAHPDLKDYLAGRDPEPLPAAAPDPAPHCGLVPPSDIDGIGSCVRPAGHAGDHLGPDADDIAWQWSPAACIAADPDHAGMTCDQYDAALDVGPAPADGGEVAHG